MVTIRETISTVPDRQRRDRPEEAGGVPGYGNWPSKLPSSGKFGVTSRSSDEEVGQIDSSPTESLPAETDGNNGTVQVLPAGTGGRRIGGRISRSTTSAGRKMQLQGVSRQGAEGPVRVWTQERSDAEATADGEGSHAESRSGARPRNGNGRTKRASNAIGVIWSTKRTSHWQGTSVPSQAEREGLLHALWWPT